MTLSWLGRLLRNRRSDASLSVWNELLAADDITLTSPAFADGEAIPRRHAGKGVGDNVSPALTWSGIPLGADHLVLVMEDTDVPFARPLIHSMSILEPDTTTLAEGDLAGTSAKAVHLTSLGRSGYQGPRPIPGHGVHRYGLMLFAVEGDIDQSSQRAAIASMAGHVLARGRIVGTYEQP